jgi:hypothetical protein
MRKLIVSRFIFIALLFSFIIINCQKARYEYFITEIFSFHTPSSISHNDTLEIELSCYLGPNSCYTFSHFEAERDSFELNLTVWGKHDIRAGVCLDIVMSIETVYRVFPLYPGLFYIEINQYNGSVLKDTVIVE